MNNTEKNDHYYRKGVILGMTFAELLMLFLFLLLLILGATIIDIKKEIARYENILKNRDQIVNLIKNKQGEKFDDIMEQLKNNDPDKAYDLLINSSPIMQEKNDTISELKSEVDQSHNIVKDCKAQNIFLNDKVKGIRPPCWADDNGKAQYIYNVVLKDDGIWITDNKVPERAEEQAKLPLQGFKFGVPMQRNEFLKAGAALKKISDKNDCKYYVRLYDKTHQYNKEHYKKLKRAVEDIFFIWESTK